MKKLTALILAALLALSAAALADTVTTTASVNLRSGPGRQYAIVTAIGAGRSLAYLGQTIADERGVDWYHAELDGKVGWVSSKYAELRKDSSARGYVPGSGIDLTAYYWKDLASSAAALGLDTFRRVESEAPLQYSGKGVTLSGNDLVEDICVVAPGYSVLGVSVGMTMLEARSLLTAAGLDVITASDSSISAGFPANNTFLGAIDNFGGGVNVEGGGGRVFRINMTTYTS